MVLVGDIRIFVTIEWGCSIGGGLLEVLRILEHQLSGSCSNHGNTGWLLSTSPHPGEGLLGSVFPVEDGLPYGHHGYTPLRLQNMHLSICKDQNVRFCRWDHGCWWCIHDFCWWMMFFELTNFNVWWWNVAMIQTYIYIYIIPLKQNGLRTKDASPWRFNFSDTWCLVEMSQDCAKTLS